MKPTPMIPDGPSEITRLVMQRRHPDRVNLYLAGHFCCGVAYEIVVAEKLKAGVTLEPMQVERLLEADARWKAKQAALSLLAVRQRARGELADRLRRKGFSPPAIEYALQEASRLELIDDRAFAESWVRDRIRLRPKGAHALVAELGRKRVPADIARDAITRVMRHDQVDERQLCHAAAQKWAHARCATPIDSQERMPLQRKLIGFLQRRGYSGEHIRAAVASLPFRDQDSAVAQRS
jgi:regulatory protein